MKTTKTPKCKNCNGEGVVHFGPPNVSRAVDMPCWICGAANFKGMSREQVAWYLAVHKAFDTLKGKSIRADAVVAPEFWLKLKNRINEAATKVGVKLEPVPMQKGSRYGMTNKEASAVLTMVAELKEYERRLEQIPVMVAQKAV